ncbi:MAG: hypothetical protein ABSG41_24540 [Bryobacteraceae bacterium]
MNHGQRIRGRLLKTIAVAIEGDLIRRAGSFRQVGLLRLALDTHDELVEAEADEEEQPRNCLPEVRAFLVKYFGTDQDPYLEELLHAVTSKDRLGLVTVHGEPCRIVDIGMRMLTLREFVPCAGVPGNVHHRSGIR